MYKYKYFYGDDVIRMSINIKTSIIYLTISDINMIKLVNIIFRNISQKYVNAVLSF